jgi:hypothetical protein
MGSGLLMNNFVTGLGDKETIVLRTPPKNFNTVDIFFSQKT